MKPTAAPQRPQYPRLISLLIKDANNGDSPLIVNGFDLTWEEAYMLETLGLFDIVGSGITATELGATILGNYQESL